jgi:TPR repeat protein
MISSRRSWDTVEEMRQAAEEGDPQAQCYLGVCYQNGQGVVQDYSEAVK